MPSPLTEARERVAAALADVPAPVLSAIPRTAAPPCVLVVPGSPWIATRGHVSIDVIAYAPAATWTPLEDLVESVRHGLWMAGLAPGPTDSPISEASLVSARTPVLLRVSCS